MLLFLLLTAILSVLSALTFFLPNVSALPFGIDDSFSFFVRTVNSLVALMPWFQILWQFILWAIFLEFLHFSWKWIKYFIGLIRGSA